MSCPALRMVILRVSYILRTYLLYVISSTKVKHRCTFSSSIPKVRTLNFSYFIFLYCQRPSSILHIALRIIRLSTNAVIIVIHHHHHSAQQQSNGINSNSRRSCPHFLISRHSIAICRCQFLSLTIYNTLQTSTYRSNVVLETSPRECDTH